MLEYHLSGAITSELLIRDQPFELLRTDCDRDGYDLVIEANGIIRHIQLKGQVLGGTAREVTAHVNLATKPSACIIWMTYDPLTMRPVSYRFFGNPPGEKIPPLGDRIATHSRGKKKQRPDHRVIFAKRFEKVADLEELVDRLFGRRHPDVSALIDHMAAQPEPTEPWLAAVRTGRFNAIPEDCDWESSAVLAHLIDGYALLEEQGREEAGLFADEALSAAGKTGRWPGGARDLWIALFLEHRRWRFASPHEPDPGQRTLLDTLVRQLREALTS
ncbi:hypothetical protein [Sphingobium fuliginis]|uniref:DUF4365 domain-containing protein n=1 Tax=Sphingobium fuliginis ATCC 27551 TaxID=1208342 RepID=A0A5B8CDX8_SPHSA|nr:hypothetical protein [Sphingobium fuliginis]QDC37748.1 hypothetical protein FIL70_11465 [Sphingobium fuliginis ATCC 27551]